MMYNLINTIRQALAIRWSLVFALLLTACSDWSSPDKNNADIIIRCSTSVSNKANQNGEYLIQYRLIDTLKGNLNEGMLDENGFLTFRRYSKEPDHTLERYLFYMKKRGSSFSDEWLNYEMVISADL